tara:strand:+ start:1406 stop:1786 length:381 start_codon:yes stop_codon:yes gene_type:complete
MKLWKEVSPYTGIEVDMDEDAPANSAGSGNVAMPPDILKHKKRKQTLIDRDGKLDGRSRAYKQHRAKLETARQKRIARKEALASKFIETIKKKSIETEMAYGSGHDTAKPMADMSNLNASKKKKKK